jgi:hypothetical protein
MHLPVQTRHLRHRVRCVTGPGSGEVEKAHMYQNTNGWPALCHSAMQWLLESWNAASQRSA